MKKWLLWLLLPALLLAGCSREEPIRTAICLRQCEDTVTIERLDAIYTALEAAGYTVAVSDAALDQARQTQQVEGLLAEDYDLLILEPVMMELAPELAQMAAEQQVPVIFLGYEPTTVPALGETMCFVGGRPEQTGVTQIRLTEQVENGCDLNGDGKVTYALIAGPEDHLDAAVWSQGCQVEGGDCLERCSTDWSRDSAAVACAGLLSTYGKDLELVLCNSDLLAQGAAEAIADGGRTVGKDIYLAGLGGELQSRLRIRSGDLTATVYLPAEEFARIVAQTAAELLAGQPVEACRYVEPVLLTKDNVEEYIAD